MPEELDRCVKKLMDEGKSESEAYAICSESTGWKRDEGGGWTKESSNKMAQLSEQEIEKIIKQPTESEEYRRYWKGTEPVKSARKFFQLWNRRGKCNRLRVMADGRVRGCLFDNQETDLKSVLRGGGDDKALEELLLAAACAKPEKHQIKAEDFLSPNRRMHGIGG